MRCSKCKNDNPYQDAPFVCWECRNVWTDESNKVTLEVNAIAEKLKEPWVVSGISWQEYWKSTNERCRFCGDIAGNHSADMQYINIDGGRCQIQCLQPEYKDKAIPYKLNTEWAENFFFCP